MSKIFEYIPISRRSSCTKVAKKVGCSIATVSRYQKIQLKANKARTKPQAKRDNVDNGYLAAEVRLRTRADDELHGLFKKGRPPSSNTHIRAKLIYDLISKENDKVHTRTSVKNLLNANLERISRLDNVRYTSTSILKILRKAPFNFGTALSADFENNIKITKVEIESCVTRSKKPEYYYLIELAVILPKQSNYSKYFKLYNTKFSQKDCLSRFAESFKKQELQNITNPTVIIESEALEGNVITGSTLLCNIKSFDSTLSYIKNLTLQLL